MILPFTPEQFLEVFRNYNLGVWPMPVVFYALALLAIAMGVKRISGAGITIGLILSFLWIWMGVVYHILYFSSINKAAYLLGGFFVLEGLLLLWLIAVKRKLTFSFSLDVYGITGAVLITFSLIIYPLIGYFLNHRYPFAPTFGLPCPTTIFTLGLLLWSDKKIPVTVIIIPLLWTVIGLTASLLLGIKEDISLIVAGILFIILWLADKGEERL